MSEENENNRDEDGFTDTITAILVVVIPVVAVIYWLSGLPNS
jgi:hypothetical protein